MKVVILCAGYATRLYPYTFDSPKPLLEVGESPLLSYLIENINKISDVSEVFVVTNDKFYNNFIEWKENEGFELKIVNDKTNSNEERLGGVMDFALAFDECKNEDVLILFGDNFFNFDLKKFVDFFKKHKETSLLLRDLQDFEKAKRFGVLEMNNGRVIGFEEKPKKPKSTLINSGAFIFPKKVFNDLKSYIDSDKNKENIGYIVIDFIKEGKDVRGLIFDEEWYDIGTTDDYERIKKDIKGLAI